MVNKYYQENFLNNKKKKSVIKIEEEKQKKYEYMRSYYLAHE